MTCALLLILLQLCLWSSQVQSAMDLSTVGTTEDANQPTLYELAVQRQDMNLQVNDGSKQYCYYQLCQEGLDYSTD